MPHSEYVLLTNQLVNVCTSWVQIEQASWSEPEHGAGEYDFGSIEYCYITLQPLETYVPEPTIDDFGVKGVTKRVMGCERILEAPIDLAFDVISDLSIRHEWMVGLIDSDMLNSKIMRNGATHRCVIKRDASDPFLVSHNFQAGKDFIAFTDTNRKAMIDTVFTLRKLGPASTRLETYIFMKKNFFKEMIVKLLMQKKILAQLEASCARLNDYCKRIVDEGRQHPARILLHPASPVSAADAA